MSLPRAYRNSGSDGHGSSKYTQGLTINAADLIRLIPVDVASYFPPYDGVFDGKIMTNRTANFARSAMTEEEA